jgi:hypothetical protein
MPTYLISHHHRPEQCPVAYAAWRGFASPLRHRPVTSSCAEGGHALWWRVEAESEEAALAQVPPYLAERSRATRVSEVQIP